MPKKGKGKQVQSPAGASQSTDPLPQVWLPNQPMPDDLDDEDLAASPPVHNLPSPSQDEQERMAQFWAMEESKGPKSWDDDQEIDYSEIAIKRGDREELNNSKDSGNPDLFRYAQSSVFTVNYLGNLRDISLDSTSDNQVKTLAAVDIAQRQGKLPWVTSENEQRSLSLSKYGIKVTDAKKQRVYTRHPLHWIANITYYEDTYGKHMLALRQSKPDASPRDHQELFIYECNDEGQAKDICLTLAQAFEAVYNKMKLEQNLHSSELR